MVLRTIFYICIVLILADISFAIKLQHHVAGFRKENITIHKWNPPTSLSSHVGKGSTKDIDPFFNFNLNLGYLRIFTKSNVIPTERYLYNSDFPFIIEFKPFDFTSFLMAGSSFSLFVERNDWLRNLTFIFSNRTFSSTQYMTSSILWFGDFLTNAVSISVIEPFSIAPTSENAFELLYPTTLDKGVGLADRFHLYQTSTTALGLMLYFELVVPIEDRDVIKNISDLPAVGQAYLGQFTPSSEITFALMGGIFYRYKKETTNINAQILYHRRDGDFDAWTVSFKQNTLFTGLEATFLDQYITYLRYYLIHWSSDTLVEEAYSQLLNLGGEIKGFGERLYWLGVGFDVMYHTITQDRDAFGGYTGEIEGVSLIPSVNWYPLAFHKKNHSLKFSLLYGFFKYYQKGEGNPSPGSSRSTEKYSDWKYSLMLRVNYNIGF